MQVIIPMDLTTVVLDSGPPTTKCALCGYAGATTVRAGKCLKCGDPIYRVDCPECSSTSKTNCCV